MNLMPFGNQKPDLNSRIACNRVLFVLKYFITLPVIPIGKREWPLGK